MNETIIPNAMARKAIPLNTPLGGLARRMLFTVLSRLETGHLTLHDRSGSYHFGALQQNPPLQAEVWVQDARFYTQALLGGSVGIGEAYMTGCWTTDNLARLIQILALNNAARNGMEQGWWRLYKPLHRWYHHLRRNTRHGSRGNIVAHYDLGNEFYKLFLDDTWTYSCAYFETETTPLTQAQTAKYERICRKLALQPTDHVMEIGTGWGGFAIHAAGRYGCRVTTTTISDRQYQLARERVQAAGVADRVQLIRKDYRDLRGQYDKLVSIEMIEAVGHHYLEAFFRACGQLLKPDGLMLLQAITMGDHVFDQHKHSVDFIKRYIFPGSCIPSITAMSRAMARQSDLRLIHLEDITPHYAQTLHLWRERFFANIEAVRALGYDETFIRMWDYYLSYCEGGFMARHVGDVQMLLAKPLHRMGIRTLPNQSRFH